MSRRSTASVRPWLIATLFALGALVSAGVAANHAFAAHHCLVHSGAQAARLLDPVAVPAKESMVPAHLRHASHALPRTSLAATLLATASIVAPVFSGDAAVIEQVVALGDAPRASGPSRAPPAA
jgi:hypothetical protein